MKEELKGKITYGSWGLICGAVIVVAYGFWFGGWITSKSSQEMINKAVSEGQIKNYAAICVAQFMNDPKSKDNLAELQKLEQTTRFEFIKKGGWDKMPGQNESVSGVDQECAYGLEDFMKK